MSTSVPSHKVEQCRMQPLSSGDGFTMDLVNARLEAVRIEMPDWMIHQLMCVLPRIDAALHPQHVMASAEFIAYSVVEWTVECAGDPPGIAVRARNEHLVDSALRFTLDDARSFHRALGEAIRLAAEPAPGPQAASKIN